MGVFLFIIVVLFVVVYAFYDSKKDEIKENKIDEAETKLGIDKGYDVGYLVYFGRDPEGKRVEWIVLDVDGANFLLLRNELLRNMIGDSSYNKIRLYLNDTSSEGFLGKYFTENEQNLIIPQEIKCEDEELNSVDGLPINSDKVFLLDINECYKYILSNSSKRCWLLRTPSTSFDSIGDGRYMHRPCLSFVAPNGLVNYGKLSSYTEIIGTASNGYLRPAMWVKMRASSETEYPMSIRDASREDFRASYVDKRRILTFGRNRQGEDVEWIILAAQPGKRFIISKHVLFKACYNGDMNETSWETCWLRKLLNDAFLNEEQESNSEQYKYEEHFFGRRAKYKYGVKLSEEEKARILEVRNDHHESPMFFTAGGKATNDKVFLLSIKEVNQYFPTDPERKAVDMNGKKSDWCTRSPGDDPTTVTFISESGHIIYPGARSYASLGVRPAMWIKVE